MASCQPLTDLKQQVMLLIQGSTTGMVKFTDPGKETLS